MEMAEEEANLALRSEDSLTAARSWSSTMYSPSIDSSPTSSVEVEEEEEEECVEEEESLRICKTLKMS